MGQTGRQRRPGDVGPEGPGAKCWEPHRGPRPRSPEAGAGLQWCFSRNKMSGVGCVLSPPLTVVLLLKAMLLDTLHH